MVGVQPVGNGGGPQAARSSAQGMGWPRMLRWTPSSSIEGAQAEKSLLRRYGNKIDFVDTRLNPCKQCYMHSIVAGSEGNLPLVCLPGYGSGAAFYYRNMESLSKDFRVHAVDWLGTGLSGRPYFRVTTTEEAEEFFTSSLSDWRSKSGIDKMVLLGHSLGGYLAASYALKYPDHVQHLILVCPAGIAKRPENYEMPENVRSPWTFSGQFWRVSKFMWNIGVTPQSIIRTLGPLGPDLIGRYVRGRFRYGMAAEEDAALLQDYFYHITASRGSGEYGLRHLLAPFAWGRHPLEHRLADLKVPITFIYGENDWMDPKAAERTIVEIKKKQGDPKTASDQQIVIIPNAGHFVFMDEPELFSQEVRQTCFSYFGANGASIQSESVTAESGSAAVDSPDPQEQLAGSKH